MRFVMFYHSLVSDWNHGNAHVLRGYATELTAAGHEVRVYEPSDGWSLRNLLEDGGDPAGYREYYPLIQSGFYAPQSIDLDRALEGAAVVLVHEWNPHELVRQIGNHHARRGGYRLFFHDTHHRSVTDPASMAAYDLSGYDGVLAYGNAIRDIYLKKGWAREVWTWHEAADTRVFRPSVFQGTNSPGVERPNAGDVVWIGNWGDGERTAELCEYLIGPVEALGLKARVYGVRYPPEALRLLEASGIEYGGWLPNYRVPEIFAHYRVTLHIPRRPYASALPGIPTIRPFEAMACGIPLISAPWEDREGLFRPGQDFLFARDADEMIAQLRKVLSDHSLANELAANGLETIRARHTCAHRAQELLTIAGQFQAEAA